MLILQERKFIKAVFESESELEQVVIDNYEYLFGPSSIYLPKKLLIKTADGFGTIPDGFAIDLASKKWYLVEAELIHHNVWNHIAPQVAKQLIASQQAISKKYLEDLAVAQFKGDETTKEKFSELGIKEIDIRKVLSEILDEEPIVGIPIDNVSNDLRDWARTLKYVVKLWIINKFAELSNPKNVAYEFPEEFKPEFDSAQESLLDDQKSNIAQYDVELIDLVNENFLIPHEKIVMDYKPRNGNPKKYIATILENGSIELLGQIYSSPSYAALAGIQDAGSNRKTVNGWTSWKNEQGITLAELREKYLRYMQEKTVITSNANL